MESRREAKAREAHAAIVRGGLRAGPKLRALRRAAGLTLVELGQELGGLRNPTLSNWETELRKPNSVSRDAVLTWSVRVAASLDLKPRQTMILPSDWDAVDVARAA
jgi:transcriptional regulator with XRE-family HTH domain